MATKPSLALIPSGYKANKLYSVLPSNGDGDFDFSRGSTATRINKDGLIENVDANVPRLDYSNGGCPSLLLEPTRTNLLPYSENYSVSNWSKIGGGTGIAPTLTSNYAISPDGTLNASRLQFDKGSGTSAGDFSILNDNVIVSSGATTSKSVYVKSNTSEEYDIVVYGAANATGTNVKKVRVTSEWQRVDVYGTVPSTSSGITIGLREINIAGLSNTADVLVWGAQLEQGSYPTSYIPTNGNIETRLAETCSNGGNEQVINSTEGVLYIETKALSNDLSERRFGLSDGTSSNVVRVGYTTVSNRIIAIVFNGANQAVLTYTSTDITQNSKIAVKYKANDFALWVDGVERSTDASGSVFTANTLNSIGFNIGGGSHFYSETKDVRVYNTVLTDEELAALTQV